MRQKEREQTSAPKSDVLTSRSPVANPKSDTDFSVFTTKEYFFNVTCP
jgi:hypothetical protein